MHNLRDEIDTLLGKIDEAHASQGSDWIDQQGQYSANEQLRPTLHVYILNQPLEKLLAEQTSDKIVESDEEPVSDETSITESDAFNQLPHSFPRSTSSRKQRYLVTLLIVVLVLLGAVASVTTTILVAQAPSALVTLIPVQKDVTATTSIGIILSKPDRMHHEIQGRLLPSLTLTQTRTVLVSRPTH